MTVTPDGWPTPGAGISADDIASVAEAQAEMMPEWVFVGDRFVSDATPPVVTYEERPIPIIGRIGRVTVRIAAALGGAYRDVGITSVLTVPLGSPLAVQNRVRVLSHAYPVIADLSQASSYATAARWLLGPGVPVDENGDPTDPTLGSYYDSVVFLRAPGTGVNPFSGDEIFDWTNPARTGPVSASVTPLGTGVELINNMEVVISRFHVECEPADVLSTDRVLWLGSTFTIDSPIAPFYKQGDLHHYGFDISRQTNG